MKIYLLTLRITNFHSRPEIKQKELTNETLLPFSYNIQCEKFSVGK